MVSRSLQKYSAAKLSIILVKSHSPDLATGILGVGVKVVELILNSTHVNLQQGIHKYILPC